MRRFFDYYRQFEELSPEEGSRGLRERRDEERARALTEAPPLDLARLLARAAHPEIVNAATFALRRAVNAYPDAGATALRRARPTATTSSPRRWSPAMAPGELLRAALQAVLAGAARGSGARGGRSWPLRTAAAARARAGGGRSRSRPGATAAADLDALPAAAGGGHPRRRPLPPNDPTGATLDPATVRRLAA